MDSILINQGNNEIFSLPKNTPLSEVFTIFFKNTVGFILVGIVIFILYKLFKYSQSDTSSGKNEGKEGLTVGLTLLIAVVFVVGTFLYLFPNLFTFIDLPAIGTSSKTTIGEPTIQTGINILTPTKIVSLGGENSTKCANPQTFLEAQKNGIQVCSATSCNKICQFDPSIKKIVIDEAQKAGADYRLLLALICQESSGKVDPPPHKNESDGTYDCGIMQINNGIKNSNSSQPCSSEIINPLTNIQQGIRLYQQKLSAVSKYKYNGVSQEAMALANYNCCGTEGSPNQPSNDCSIKNGFPYDLPKWACPINPGGSKTNMCFVKNYSCNVLACAKNY